MAFMTGFQSGTPAEASTLSPADPTASSAVQYNLPVALNPSHVRRLRGEGFGQPSIRTTSDSDLLTLAKASGIIPDEKQSERREAAVEAFCSMIGASRELSAMQGLAAKLTGDSNEFLDARRPCSVKLVLVPIGAHAIGDHFPDSDIDCIVVGNISPPNFWATVEQKLTWVRDDAKNANVLTPVVLSRSVEDAVVQMMTFRIDRCILRIRYSLATVLAENWSRLVDSDDDNAFQVPDPSMKLLNACRDRKRLYNSLPFRSFQLASRLVKLFCIRRGIYGPHLGFLGEVHLEVMMRLVARRLPESFSAFELIREFFRTYSCFDWASQTLNVTDSRTVYKRSPQEPMVILSPESAAINVAASASFSTRQTIIKELCLACDLLAESVPLEQIWTSEAISLSAFLNGYPSFVKIDVGYWGASCTSARALIGYIESWLARLSIDLDSADTNTRLWPNHLTDSTYMVTGGATSFVQGFYLLGLQRQRNDESMRQLIGVLGDFEDSVRTDTCYFDPSTSFFAAAICAREDLLQYGNIEANKPLWRDDGIDESLNIQEDSEAGINPAFYWKEAEGNRDRQENFVNQLTSKKPRKHAIKNLAKPADQVPVARLRTSADVYNRLVWDRRYDAADYLIGYEDRFVGTKEMPLKGWCRQIEDENFACIFPFPRVCSQLTGSKLNPMSQIPFHRIVYFRCKSTGELIWDRQTKLDRVFGSGALTSGE